MRKGCLQRGLKDVPLGEESNATENRETEQREHEDSHRYSQTGSYAPKSGVVFNVHVVLARPAQSDDYRERSQRRDGVGEQVKHERGAAEARTDDDCNQDVACMRNARVGEQALDVALSQRNQISDDHRNRRQPPHGFVPDVKQRRKRLEPEAEERGEGRTFYRRGHVRGDRRRRAFVSIGSPHVERCRRNLEPEADENQRDSHQQQSIVLEAEADDVRPDLDEVSGAGCAVDERDTVQQEGGRKGAEQEILDCSFGGALGPAIDTDQHVDRDRHELDPEEHDDQVACCGEDHHSGSRQQQQHVRLARSNPLAHIVVERHCNRAQRRDEENLVGRPAEIVDCDHSDRRRVPRVGVVTDRYHGEDAERHAEDADSALMLIAFLAPTRKEKEQHRSAHQQQIGTEGGRELGRHGQIEIHQGAASLTRGALVPA